MLNQKKTLTKIMENALQVQTVSQSVSFSGQSYVDILYTLPTGATVVAVAITKAPNPNWIIANIANYGANSARVSYWNQYSGAISGTVEIAVFYKV